MPFRFQKFIRSNAKGKKYAAILKDPEGRDVTVNFGDRTHEHYKDSTGLGLYSSQDHLDRERRDRYLRRSAGIRDGRGRLTKDNPLSANFYARRFLWASGEPLSLN